MLHVEFGWFLTQECRQGFLEVVVVVYRRAYPNDVLVDLFLVDWLGLFTL